MQHYFLKDLINKRAIFNDEDIHHILHVMRFKNNDKVIGIFNKIKYVLELKISNDVCEGLVIETKQTISNTLDVTLIYGMPKNDKFELVLMKASELGVKTIVPFLSERSVIKLDNKDIDKKMDRWNKIIKESCEQSERDELTILKEPITLKDINNYLSESNIVCDENLGRSDGLSLFSFLTKNYNSKITILIGPEGGFSKKEFDYFKQLNIVSISLGKRILRSETAVIYALSCLSLFKEQ